ncbi:MAG TPA: hypothetical protein VH325_02295 [Bryobacteraceae bacterium]|jgi:hypothetical protein|nr:hypothetical protein [Bryobacteraceae bacterium]
MTVKQAREAARQWMVQEASNIPGFRGAYTAGSTNWLPDDAELTTASDLDIMVILADQNQAGRRGKFIYNNTLLEVSYLRNDQLQSPDQVLSDYHLAPSFRTAKIMFDPLGHLTPLLAAVSRDYNKRQWVRQRCVNARDKVLTHLRSINEQAAFHDQVMACLFGAGVTTHVLLVAGLGNPTVRARYVAVRELLADYGHVEFHETLLELLGVALLIRERVTHHLATLSEIFTAAKTAIRTPFPFATDISDIGRAIAIDAAFELIGRGYHREVMFWIGVTHSRCQTILSHDAPGDLTQRFKDSYQELAGDLGVPTLNEIRQRCAEIERTLPRVCEVAEEIIAANHESG